MKILTKNTALFTTTLLICFNLITTHCPSQTIEWIYEVQAKEKTIPRYFWVDEHGNGFYNIYKQNPNNPGDMSYGSFMLMLDNDGQYTRTTKINSCDKIVGLLPFGQDKLIASGFDCHGKLPSKETRLFDYKGETLKINQASFPGNFFANVHTKDGFVFFSKPNERWGYSFISIGKIDEDLNVTYDSVSIKSLTQDTLGITCPLQDPALTENGTWVIPLEYGEVMDHGFGMTPQHGIVIGVGKSKILWQYPSQLNGYRVENVCTYKDKIGVLMSPADCGNGLSFALLSQNGKELSKFRLQTKGLVSVRDLILTDKYIVVLGTKNLLVYDRKGNLMNNFELQKEQLSQANRMQLLPDGSIIFSARRNENAVIVKINLEAEAVNEEPAEAGAEISYSSIDEDVDKAIIAATVYPNPTSSFINFEFKMEMEANPSFVIQIFNASGQLMKTENFSQQNQPIDVQAFPAGTYIYKITAAGQRKLLTGQFIKVTR